MTDSVSDDPFDYLARSEDFRLLMLHCSRASPGVRYTVGHLYGEKDFVGGSPVVKVWGSSNQIAPRVVDAVTAEELAQGPIGEDSGGNGVEEVGGNHADWRIKRKT